MRRLYYVKPKIQNPIIKCFVFLMAIEMLIFRFFLYIIQQVQPQISHDLFVYVQFGVLLIVISIFSFVNFFIATRLSHRIAGPLVQVQRVLEYALKGEYETRIQLRSGDFLHEFGDKINSMLDMLEDNQTNKPHLDKSTDDKNNMSSINQVSTKEVYK